jgi:hypothetical protein
LLSTAHYAHATIYAGGELTSPALCLQVQRTIGVSDYVRRDMALKNLIQPLAGEYGMHNNQPQLKTHRCEQGELAA